MVENINKEKIDELFGLAGGPVAKFNKLCTFGAFDRNKAYDEIKTNICANRLTKKQKKLKFDAARVLLKKSLLVVDDGNREEAEILSKEIGDLLDAGEKLTCGGGMMEIDNM